MRQACCAVASDSPAEVSLVRSLLEREFSEILPVSCEADWQPFAQRHDVAVLILAFHDLPAAENFQLRYATARPGRSANRAQAVMLCSRDNVEAAYDLCRSHSVSDYVLFWPVTHDALRLPLAAHRACDTFERLCTPQLSGDATATTAAAEAVVVPLRVLVVEDDSFQLAVTLGMLTAAGLHTTGAPSAQAALQLIGVAMPDLILLDVDMPGMGGLALLRVLKAMPDVAHIPVIMLTVLRERGMVLEAVHDGAADFIAKPFDRDTLLQKLRRVAGRNEPQPVMDTAR
jgi:CheY-like chemotaxis protein